MKTSFVLTGLVLLMAVTACGRTERALRADRVTFDGLTFRSSTNVNKEDRRDFSVTVRKASRNLTAAQEAAEFEANRYCLGAYGGSDIAWSVDPYKEADELTASEDDTLTIAGRCTKR